MPTYSYEVIKHNYSNSQGTFGLEYVNFEIFAPTSSSTFSYQEDPNSSSSRDLAEVIFDADGVNFEIEGRNFNDFDKRLFLGEIEWDGNVTQLLVIAEDEDPSLEYIITLGGTPFPRFNSFEEIEAFVDSVTLERPISSGQFAPNTDIPFSSLLGVSLTENDTVLGTGTDDSIATGIGDDRITGREGDDDLNGGEGQDTAAYSGNQAQYTLRLGPDGTSITDRSGVNGTDSLTSIELLDFDSGIFNLQQVSGLVDVSASDMQSFIELYIAYFNRAPDAVGLSFWGTAFANGTSLEQMATLFIDQDETRETYAADLSNADFVTAVYANVLGRVGDQPGVEFWLSNLESGAVGRDQFILGVLEGAKAPIEGASAELQAQQEADQQFLSTKTDIGTYYAVTKGMSNPQNALSAMAMFDGTSGSLDAVQNTIDGYYADALNADNGAFLMQLVGILDDPFAGVA